MQHLALPELSFELSIGEVVIILIVTALILLVITIERTERTIAKRTKPPPAPSPLLAMRECPARFGFLQRLPRGSTIPQECYVCAQLIECLGYQRTPRLQK